MGFSSNIKARINSTENRALVINFKLKQLSQTNKWILANNTYYMFINFVKFNQFFFPVPKVQ